MSKLKGSILSSMDNRPDDLTQALSMENNRADVHLYEKMQRFCVQISTDEKSGLRLFPYLRPPGTYMGEETNVEPYAIDGPLSFVLEDESSGIGRILSFYRGDDAEFLKRYGQLGLDTDLITSNDLIIVQLQGPCGEWKDERKEKNLPTDSLKFNNFRWEKSLLYIIEAFATMHGFHKLHILPAQYNFDLHQINQDILTDRNAHRILGKDFRNMSSMTAVESSIRILEDRKDRLFGQLHMRYDITAKRLGYKQPTSASPFELSLHTEKHVPEFADLEKLTQGQANVLSLGDFIYK